MQRLAVAVGILMNREIIILDEPTSGFDYLNMLEIGEGCSKDTKTALRWYKTAAEVGYEEAQDMLAEFE